MSSVSIARSGERDKAVAVAEARPLGWYGMVFFIASEAVFFANLIAAYLYLHVHAGPQWPTLDLDKVLAAVNTVILVSSSFVLTFAARSLNRGNRRAFSG